MTNLSKTPCKAKNPRTCRYHSAILRMEKAAKKGDLDAYFEARQQAENDVLLGWDEEKQSIPADPPRPPVTFHGTIEDVHKAINEEWEQFYARVPEMEKEWYLNHYLPQPGLTLLASEIAAELYNRENLKVYAPSHTPTSVGNIRAVEGSLDYNRDGSKIWFVFELGGRYFYAEGNRDNQGRENWSYPILEVEYTPRAVKPVINSVVTPLKGQ